MLIPNVTPRRCARMAIPLRDFLPSGRLEGSKDWVDDVGVGVLDSCDGFADGEGRQPGSERRSVGQEILGFPGVGWIPEEIASWVMADGGIL